MIKNTLKIVALAILLVLMVLVVNTFLFTKTITEAKAIDVPAIPDSAVAHMQQAIRIKTISYGEKLPIDTAEFIRFRAFLEKSFPLVHQKLQRQSFNQFSYLYKWEGKNKDAKPYVLMAHMDVVPVEASTEKFWSVPTFGGIVRNDTIFGRGAADDKCNLIAILEATEKLLAQHYQPERTIYLSFGHDEEISGYHGAKTIAQWFKNQQIHPEIVVDEGGEITNEAFKSLKRPVSLIGVAEKGYMSFQLSVDKPGGHSSMPAKETAIDILTAALYRLRKNPMPYKIHPAVSEMFNRVGPGLPFIQRMALANRWLMEGLLVKSLEADNGFNALIRTTIVPTIVQTGIKDNVIPTMATAIVNSRILPGQSTDEVEAFYKTQINDDRVKITRISEPIEEGPSASYKSKAFTTVENITYQIMPKVIPVPFLCIGATDSKYFQSFSDGVVKFSPCIDPKGFHGIDERLPISDLKRTIFFYELLLKSASSNALVKQ